MDIPKGILFVLSVFLRCTNSYLDECKQSISSDSEIFGRVLIDSFLFDNNSYGELSFYEHFVTFYYNVEKKSWGHFSYKIICLDNGSMWFQSCLLL